MLCVAYPLSSGIDFNYLNLCGDHSIRNSMLGKPIGLTIRPNPAQDEIKVDISYTEKQEVMIEIFDALGQKVFSDSYSMSSGTSTTPIDTRNLSIGVYLLRLHSASGSV